MEVAAFAAVREMSNVALKFLTDIMPGGMAQSLVVRIITMRKQLCSCALNEWRVAFPPRKDVLFEAGEVIERADSVSRALWDVTSIEL